ncbi:MAG: hypothetical protein ACF8GE_12120 [Phycisphaerales bacterium JB043]
MLRSLLAAIASFIAMAVAIAAMFLVVTMVLGIEGTLRPGEYWTSSTFNTTVLIGGTVISAMSGMLCFVIAKSCKPALAVGVVILGYGLYSAVQNEGKDDPPAREVRAESESATDYTVRVLQEMAEVGKEPTWFAFANPFIGSFAFVAGAGVLGRSKSPSTNRADPDD